MNSDARLATASLDLRPLAETCGDGAAGYRQAAKDIHEPALAEELVRFADERERFAEELRGWVTRLGEQCPSESSVAAGLHRDWINIKSVFYPQPEAAVLGECERGEDIAVEKYQQVLEHDLPDEIEAMLSRQLAAIESARARIRELCARRAEV